MRVPAAGAAWTASADASTFRIADRVAWILAATLLGFQLASLARYAVDWPLHDDFTQILAIPGYLVPLQSPGEKLALLVEPVLEHRPATVRLLGWLGSLMPGGLNFALLIALGNAMAIAAGIVVVFVFPTASRAAAALLAALLLTSPTHYAAQYHATGALQHFGVSCYALIALFALHRGHRVVVPPLFALAAVFTSASGLMVFPAAVLLLALLRRAREAVAWTLAGIATTLAYFAGSSTTAGVAGLARLAADPGGLAVTALAALGSIGFSVTTSIAIGVAIVVVWTALLGSGAWRRLPPVVVTGALLFALTCAAIAAGRAVLGVEAVTLSRYRSYSALALLLTFAALAWTIDMRRMRIVFAGASAGVVALFALAWIALMPPLVDLSMMQIALRDHFVADGRGHYDGYTQSFGDFTLQRATFVNAYNSDRRSAPPLRVDAAALPASREWPSLDVHLYAGERVASVTGSMDGDLRDVVLWLGGDAGAFRTSLAVLGYHGGPGVGPRTAFRGTVSLGGLLPGRYRVGYSDGNGAVSWTVHRVDVR